MEGVMLRNVNTGLSVVVKNGKVYDGITMIELPEDSIITTSAIEHLQNKMNILWNKMGEIDPVWGDLQLYHSLEADWLQVRYALYGVA